MTPTQPVVEDLIVTVLDKDTGEKIEGVLVEITKPDKTKFTEETDSDGRVRLPKGVLGDYEISILKVPEGKNVKVGSIGRVKLKGDVLALEVIVAGDNLGRLDTDGNFLPITGKLVWPITVFSALGLVFLAVGFMDTMKRKKEEDKE